MLIFPAVLLLVQQEFGLGYASLGVFANVALLGYGVGALPAGMLADRLGSHRILSIWLVGGSLACLSIGLSAGPVGLVIGLAVLGLFGSLHHPAGSGVLVALRNVGSPEVGRAFGITFTLGFGVGSLASSLMGVIAQRFGLPAVFLSLG
ncbi:MAG: MFS transporter, partial [candidate division NC10 bacterium]